MAKKICKAGYTVIEIMIVVTIIGVLAALAIPSMIRSRASAQANACIYNMKQIEAADNQFSIDHAMPAGSTNFTYPTDLLPYFKQNEAPVCPARGTYAVAAVFAPPTCSLSNTVTPAHMLP